MSVQAQLSISFGPNFILKRSQTPPPPEKQGKHTHTYTQWRKTQTEAVATAAFLARCINTTPLSY